MFNFAGMAGLDVLLEWLVIGFAIVVVLGFIVYILMRVLRTLDKADRYFESREKESEQPNQLQRRS